MTDNKTNALGALTATLRAMHGQVFYVEDADGYLRRWTPPEPPEPDVTDRMEGLPPRVWLEGATANKHWHEDCDALLSPQGAYVLDTGRPRVKPLRWSVPFPPGEHGRSYDHVYAHIPGDTLYIEWDVEWGTGPHLTNFRCGCTFYNSGQTFVAETTLEGAKKAVQDRWNAYIWSALAGYP